MGRSDQGDRRIVGLKACAARVKAAAAPFRLPLSWDYRRIAQQGGRPMQAFRARVTAAVSV